jgi:hypothetical protein
MHHVTYTSKQRRLTTKKVVSADNCSHLHLNFFGFERTIGYVLNGDSIKSWPLISKWVSALGHSCSSQYKCSVSKASQRTFGLSTGELFASNDSKTCFELRNKWPLNRQLRRFFEDKYLTSAVNFPTTAVKFCLFKRQICRWHGTKSRLAFPTMNTKQCSHITHWLCTATPTRVCRQWQIPIEVKLKVYIKITDFTIFLTAEDARSTCDTFVLIWLILHSTSNAKLLCKNCGNFFCSHQL